MLENTNINQEDVRRTREFRFDLLKMKVQASIQTDAGCVREANEDFGRHFVPSDEDLKKNRGILTVIADGMGGHASGEVASKMAVELISEFYYQNAESPADFALKSAVERAATEIYLASQKDEKLFGMGTTLIALVLLENRAFSAHVGDSRLYLLRGREMRLLTMDHSQVMELVKEGIISLEQAWDHDDKNIILRAVGTQPNVEAEISDFFATEIGDEFLVCSDGLNDMLTDAEIADIWNDAKNIHEACENLINAAKEQGGHDNVTVGIIGISTENEINEKRAVPQTRETGRLEI